MPSASEGLLAGRFRLTDHPERLDVPGRIVALDSLSGVRVALEAVPLPEVVSADLLDDGIGAVYGLPPEDGAQQSDLGGRAARHAAKVADAVPAHPRLLQVFEVLECDGFLWVVGEHLPGVPLARLLEQGPLPVHRAAEIIGDLLGALSAVHSAGIVHGNVTAETVLVCEDGTAMLGGLGTGAVQETLCDDRDGKAAVAAVEAGTDWTLARVRSRDVRLGLTGACAERWAPEQVGPPKDCRASYSLPLPPAAVQPPDHVPPPRRPLPGERVGPAADCWAIGVLLFRMLTGRAPFPEEDTAALFGAIRAGRRLSTESCGPLRPVVEELLRPEPAARPEPAQVRRRLARLLSRAPEPYDPASAGVAELLPAISRAGTPARRRHGEPELRGRAGLPMPRPGRPPGVRRPARRRTGLLGPLLVGGLILTVLLVLTVTAGLVG